MALLQDLVHRIEVAANNRFFRYAPAVLAILLVGLTYDLRQYRNFSTLEAMDAAQLGRRLSEGRGYTTLFIRPLSMHLVSRAQRPSNPATGSDQHPDYARIKVAHPDIANPPIYPVMLAAGIYSLVALAKPEVKLLMNQPPWTD